MNLILLIWRRCAHTIQFVRRQTFLMNVTATEVAGANFFFLEISMFNELIFAQEEVFVMAAA